METKTVLSRVTDYGKKPRTVGEALRQARDLLAEEKKFCKNTLFKDGSAQKAFENGSICGNWQVCSLGAIGVVTGDLSIQVSKEAYDYDGDEADYWWEEDNMQECIEDNTTLTYRAAEVLALAIIDKKGETVDGIDYYGNPEPEYKAYFSNNSTFRADEPTEVVAAFNDHTTRGQVLKAFDHAIELARNPKQLAQLRSTIQGEQ